MSVFDNHSHTHFSNTRLLDCINKPKLLIDKAIELGLSGIAITDHECLSAHMEINQYAKQLRETHPDFTIALGNEIYLVDTLEMGQKYYHFLLLAKDAIGHRALRELSSTAWLQSYYDRGLERVPLLKTQLAEIMRRFKGHLIASTACLGGELGTLLQEMITCEKNEDLAGAAASHNQIVQFLEFCIEVFGKEDFYIECAPACSKEQIEVNKRLYNVAKAFGLRMCVGSDAHYLTTADRYVHKAYLNSKGGEREVDSFYEYAHLMSEDEMRDNLRKSYDDEIIDWIFSCSETIKEKITWYSLEKKQKIPEVQVKDYPKSLSYFGVNNDLKDNLDSRWPVLKSLFLSDNIQERYWVNECFKGLIDKNIGLDEKYLDRLEEEARVKRIIGDKLETCMFAYPNTLKHYIDLFWECGSTVGAGRGSSCAALNHYLLGITQLNPVEWNLPFFRYLNEERTELGDIDIDLAPSKLQKIFAAIREERGELGLVQVCTFGTEGTKSTVINSCRSYRSTDYPNGIDVDEAQYLSSLVPIERGFAYSLSDLFYGNEEKDRKPNKTFIAEVKKFPGLQEIMFGIENLVCRRGIHASGVILFDNDIYNSAAVMKAPNGAITTQWDLHMSEAAGSVKYDLLLTSVQDILIKTIELLQNDGQIDPHLSLKEAYDKYLHPSVLPQDDPAMWNALANNDVLCCFQFDSPVGMQAAKKIQPKTPLELSDANGLMRLMTNEPGAETPIDKYVRFKNNIKLWYQEMDEAGLTKQEQKILEPYFLSSYGVPPSQEQLMLMLMDKDICGFTLAEANNARKVIGKKLMSKIPELKEKVLSQASSTCLGEYVWRHGAGPQMGYSFSVVMALTYFAHLL